MKMSRREEVMDRLPEIVAQPNGLGRQRAADHPTYRDRLHAMCHALQLRQGAVNVVSELHQIARRRRSRERIALTLVLLGIPQL